MKSKTFAPVPLLIAGAVLLPVAIALFPVAGCGGGSVPGGTAHAPIRVARAVVSVAWPARPDTRLVPLAANSVRVTITNGAGFRVSQVVTRPAPDAVFGDLPPGVLTVTATAHADGAGDVSPAQAAGTQIVTVAADQTFALGLTMDSTIDRLALTAAANSAVPGQSVLFAANALDAAGNTVLTGNTWQWRSDTPAVATGVPTGTGFLVTAAAPGTAVIMVTETESGKTATLSLPVATPPSPTPTPSPTPAPSPTPPPNPFAGVEEYTTINVNALPNYANPLYPPHYDNTVRGQDNTPADNPITDRGATLGRVLFHDKRLSTSDTVSCASCHGQSSGFTDPRRFSTGVSGAVFTSAHAMRLANVRFYGGNTMFWDKRAASVEAQASQPIQNSAEMGFDAAHGGFAAVIVKMQALPYYPELFRWTFGDAAITEDRVQKALAQYERGIVSVNSRFDTEYARVYDPATPQAGVGAPFPGFTPQENRGKMLFVTGPNQGGAGCNTCHQSPSFALDRNSRSNGLDAGESRIFKSPSLKNSALAGSYMHDGRFATLEQVVDHYISGVQNGPALDNRLRPGGQPQRLPLSTADRDALVAFLRTLNDPVVTSDPKFTDPFVK